MIRTAKTVFALTLAVALIGWPPPLISQGSRVLPVQKPSPDARDAPARPGFRLPRFGGTRSGGQNALQKQLMAAYPGAFTIEGNDVIFPSGERVVWDDGRQKSASERLTHADVEDMFAYRYPPAAAGPGAPRRAEDPGRIRSQAFFKALYGSNAGAVRQSVRSVPWVPALGGGSLTVTTKFGIDQKIAAISAELERLPSRYHSYLKPPAGAFLWRQIAGTNRLSVHSFGAAVDIATRHANYWRWDKGRAGGPFPYRNEIPLEIVAVFEKYCFIWGGRWYHYDTMHFEYRPELLPGCRQ